MYKKLLVLLDGSQLAEVVLPCAKDLAGRLNMDVVLLHVYPPTRQEFAPMYKAYLDRTAETIKAQAVRLQKSFGKEIGKFVDVTSELIMGYHADVILRYADENAIDLILMANHGRSGVSRWSMGSVADKILRAAKVPVWLVRTELDNTVPYDKWPNRTLLVPLSGSEISASVIPHAIELAKQNGATVNVVLMQVCEPPVAPSYYSPELTGVPLNWGQFIEQEMTRSKENSQRYLSGQESKFKDAGIPVKSLVLTGKPAEEIIAYGNKNPFTVFVMATHGRSGLSRLVYGSVAESVLFGITNPIVLVRP
jgi:nucleotide-binding universal stress UspA family protein